MPHTPETRAKFRQTARDAFRAFERIRNSPQLTDMTTTTRPLGRKQIRSRLTAIQKVRVIIMTIFDVEQAEIAQSTGNDRGIISNIFRDKHRSPVVERAVVDYLNSKRASLTIDDRMMLDDIGLSGELTVKDMGWPESA